MASGEIIGGIVVLHLAVASVLVIVVVVGAPSIHQPVAVAILVSNKHITIPSPSPRRYDIELVMRINKQPVRGPRQELLVLRAICSREEHA